MRSQKVRSTHPSCLRPTCRQVCSSPELHNGDRGGRDKSRGKRDAENSSTAVPMTLISTTELKDTNKREVREPKRPTKDANVTTPSNPHLTNLIMFRLHSFQVYTRVRASIRGACTACSCVRSQCCVFQRWRLTVAMARPAHQLPTTRATLREPLRHTHTPWHVLTTPVPSRMPRGPRTGQSHAPRPGTLRVMIAEKKNKTYTYTSRRSEPVRKKKNLKSDARSRPSATHYIQGPRVKKRLSAPRCGP